MQLESRSLPYEAERTPRSGAGEGARARQARHCWIETRVQQTRLQHNPIDKPYIR